MWDKQKLPIFCLKESHVYFQAIFACPILERTPPPFYHIRHEPMAKLVVLFNHWTSKNCLGVHMSFFQAKNAPTYVICIIMINMKNILHCLYFASFKLFNRIISMYLLRANIHNKKHTYAEAQMQTDTCISSYQPIGLFFGVSICSHFDVFFFNYFFYMFTLLSLFNSSTIFTQPSNSIFILNEAHNIPS